MLISCFFLQSCSKDNQVDTDIPEFSDSERFALEFPQVGSDNVFVYRTAGETADILANGRGIVFMGFKDCPWCQPYVVFLNELAKEMEIDKIYYCDIREDRQNNTESYQKILEILTNRLGYNDEGHPRVFVPDLSIVSRGRIITRDFMTVEDRIGYDTPQEYWNDERVNELKERLRAGMSILKQISRPCDAC
jgi:hypothetical protein